MKNSKGIRSKTKQASSLGWDDKRGVIRLTDLTHQRQSRKTYFWEIKGNGFPLIDVLSPILGALRHTRIQWWCKAADQCNEHSYAKASWFNRLAEWALCLPINLLTWQASEHLVGKQTGCSHDGLSILLNWHEGPQVCSQRLKHTYQLEWPGMIQQEPV